MSTPGDGNYASATIQPDDAFDDEGYTQSTTTSYVTSIASDIRRGIEENGRTYPAFGQNFQGLPIDEEEQDRNDLQHCKINLILEGKLHLAPIAPSPHKILDLGTGSGIWAIDMADKYPSALVLGVDIAAVQPTWVPPNCQFEIDDIESDWTYSPNSFDFIHAREFLLSIRNWKRLIEQAVECLKPGGYLEVSGTYPLPTSDDNTIPENSAYVEFGETMRQIGEIIQAPVDAPVFWKQQFSDSGLERVEERIFKVPTSPWPKDPRLKKVGAFELANFIQGAEGFLVRGYTTILGGSREQAEILLARSRNEVKNRNMHSYVFFYNVIGQKSLDGPTTSASPREES